jgi:hypothetical protein
MALLHPTIAHIYLGPKVPAGKEGQWIKTKPGKGWFTHHHYVFTLWTQWKQAGRSPLEAAEQRAARGTP